MHNNEVIKDSASEKGISFFFDCAMLFQSPADITVSVTRFVHMKRNYGTAQRIAGALKLEDHHGLFQPRPFYDSIRVFC